MEARNSLNANNLYVIETEMSACETPAAEVNAQQDLSGADGNAESDPPGKAFLGKNESTYKMKQSQKIKNEGNLKWLSSVIIEKWPQNQIEMIIPQ